MPMSPETPDSSAALRVLDAAERLFYARGVQAVGVDMVVAEAGVGVKTLYAHFGSKDRLVEAYLRRRDRRWLDRLRARMAQEQGRDRVLAVFDALGDWFAEPGFSGCAFINVAGELHANPALRAIAREHKIALRALLHSAAYDAAVVVDPETLAERLMLLVEGAIVTAHVEGDQLAATRARSAAAALLDCSDHSDDRNAANLSAERLQ